MILGKISFAWYPIYLSILCNKLKWILLWNFALGNVLLLCFLNGNYWNSFYWLQHLQHYYPYGINSLTSQITSIKKKKKKNLINILYLFACSLNFKQNFMRLSRKKKIHWRNLWRDSGFFWRYKKIWYFIHLVISLWKIYMSAIKKSMGHYKRVFRSQKRNL